ncbi:MAG: TonB family protein [Gemmatimonadaceae bacterium]|nr:TonB family protein [Gemmatimonadaceae bacterium]
MTVAWLLASIVTSALVGAAALCVERVLMLRRGVPVRWVWVAAITLSLLWSTRGLLPTPAPMLPPLPRTETLSGADVGTAPRSAVPTMPAVEGIATPPIRETWSPPHWMSAPWPAVSAQAERVVHLAWGAAAAALLLALTWSTLRLHREKRRWRPMSLVGTDVLVSDGFGPAIVGLWRPRIVVPSWVLEVDANTQRTILLHEDEHRRVGDQWLLLWSFLAVVLAPWNVVLWAMSRRLARTIELDCDERVLAHGVVDVDYANVLLNAWQRARHVVPWVPSPALAEHVSRLGRRVQHLMRPSPRRRAMKTIGGVSASALFLAIAMLVPRPQQAQERAVVVKAAAATVTTPATITQALDTPSAAAGGIKSARPSSLLPAADASPTSPTDEDSASVVAVSLQSTNDVQLQRARVAVIMPFDSVGMPIAELVHRYLASDVERYAIQVISPKELKSFLSASGFSMSAALSPRDVRALGSLVRADLVVSATLSGSGDSITIDASIGSPSDLTFRSLRKGTGTSIAVAEVIIEGMRTDSAFLRLRRPLPPQPTVAARPAVFRPGTMGPAYPAELREASVSGDVVARFVVDTNNRVDESTIAILASDRPQFAVSVIQSLRTTQFLAAERDGVKIRHTMHVAFQFATEGKGTRINIVTDDAAIRDIRQRFDARAPR